MAFRSTYSPPTFAYLTLSAPAGAALPIGSNVIACRFRFDDLTQDYEVIEINDSVGGAYASAIVYNSASGQLQYIQRDSSGAGPVVNVSGIAANTWYHACLQWDQTNCNAYLNGVFQGQSSTPALGSRGNWSALQVGPCRGELQDAVFISGSGFVVAIQALAKSRRPMAISPQNKIRAFLPCFPGADRIIDYTGLNNFTAVGTPTDSTGPQPQAPFGTASGQYLWTDLDATPKPAAVSSGTEFGGDAAALSGRLAAVSGGTEFGGNADALRGRLGAMSGGIEFGGNAGAVVAKIAACSGGTEFGGTASGGPIVRAAACSGGTEFGGTAAATGGGNNPLTPSEFRRRFRYGPRH